MSRAARARGLALATTRGLGSTSGLVLARTCGLVLALVACAGAAHAASDSAPTHECRIEGFAHAVQCGSVRRPLDPARPEGASIDVHYVVVPALARRKLPDPVFFLAGGPGQSAIAVAPVVMPLLQRLQNRRDIVFVDQRGTGRSAPLTCTDAREPFSDASDVERQVARLERCRAGLEASKATGGAEGLKHFTTTEAMQDLDAVRRVLGAERIDVIGGSYGTRAALEYQRQFPAAVRRMVIDGVAPPDMALTTTLSADAQAAFDALLASCERDAACARAHPALRAHWRALLDAPARHVDAIDPLTGERRPWRLTREAVLGAVRGPLYVPSLAAGLPAAIDDAAQGRFDGLVGLASMLSGRRSSDLALGMHFSVVCAEDEPRAARSGERPGADFGDEIARFYARVCERWPRGAVPAAFYTVPRSANPVLLLSGGLDPVTPPRHAARVAAALGPLARHVVVPNAGHGVMTVGCMRDVVHRFIDGADDAAALAVDAGCAASMPRPPAFEPIVRAKASP